jgi:hypothetical protein
MRPPAWECVRRGCSRAACPHSDVLGFGVAPGMDGHLDAGRSIHPIPTRECQPSRSTVGRTCRDLQASRRGDVAIAPPDPCDSVRRCLHRDCRRDPRTYQQSGLREEPRHTACVVARRLQDPGLRPDLQGHSAQDHTVGRRWPMGEDVGRAVELVFCLCTGAVVGHRRPTRRRTIGFGTVVMPACGQHADAQDAEDH